MAKKKNAPENEHYTEFDLEGNKSFFDFLKKTFGKKTEGCIRRKRYSKIKKQRGKKKTPPSSKE